MARLLVTGASGLLGREIARQALAAGWDVVGTYFTAPLGLPLAWRPLELADRAAVLALLEEVRPAVVVHCAARDRGEGMWAACATGAAHVALAARAVGARLVHLSTDALFDGTASPYKEADPPHPITPYGAAKAAAETAVAAIAPTAAVVRTSLILSLDPLDKHQRLALDLAAGRQQGGLFTDEVRCPVAVEDLAAAVLELAAGDFAGVLHVAGPEAVSRLELGRLVAVRHGLNPKSLPASSLAGSGLHRPADLRLDSGLARSVLRTRLRGASEYLRADDS